MSRLELIHRIQYITGNKDRSYDDVKGTQLTKVYKQLISSPFGKQKALEFDNGSASPLVLG